MSAVNRLNHTNEEIISLIDLTLLEENATESDIKQLAVKAATHQVAAICVYPHHLPFIAAPTIKKATVLNFPSGENLQEQVFRELTTILDTQGVDEIDYVFPYRTYLLENKLKALKVCQEIKELVRRKNKTFKVILETGEIKRLETIYELSLKLIEQDCDFLKTSTGKTHTGATLDATFAILRAIKDTKSSCGIKISGGIKTVEQAKEYIALAELVLNKKVNPQWFRIGASSLLDKLLKN